MRLPSFFYFLPFSREVGTVLIDEGEQIRSSLRRRTWRRSTTCIRSPEMYVFHSRSFFTSPLPSPLTSLPLPSLRLFLTQHHIPLELPLLSSPRRLPPLRSRPPFRLSALSPSTLPSPPSSSSSPLLCRLRFSLPTALSPPSSSHLINPQYRSLCDYGVPPSEASSGLLFGWRIKEDLGWDYEITTREENWLSRAAVKGKKE